MSDEKKFCLKVLDEEIETAKSTNELELLTALELVRQYINDVRD